MDDLSLRTMHVFVSKALTRIVEECGRRPSALRTACLAVLEQTKEGRLAMDGHEPADEATPGTGDPDEPGAGAAGSAARSGVAAVYFGPLHLACESGNPRIMEAALSCTQKLIAYGFVTANMHALPVPDGARARSGADGAEHSGGEHGGPGGGGGGQLLSSRIVEVICACKDEEDEAVQLQVVKAALTAVTTPTAGVHDTVLLLAVKTCYHLHLVGVSALIRATALGGLNQMLHMVYSRVEFAAQNTGAAAAGAASGAAAAGAAAGATAAGGAAEGGGSDSAPATPQPARKAAAGVPSTAPAGLAPSLPAGEDGLGSVSVAQRDAFLVLRALCKLSMKPLPESADGAGGGGADGVGEESIDLRSKLLSLSLLVSILSSESGLKFRQGDRFIAAVKQYLCLSLLKNGVCPRPAVLELSLRLFSTLLQHFRDHLKNEIGVVFSNIFLLILESQNSTSAQKGLTLSALHRLLSQPQLVVDLFINYDCDVEGASLFSRIAADLSKLAQLAPAPHEAGAPAEAHTADELRLSAVRALTALVHSLSRWAAKGGAGGGPPSEAGDDGEPPTVREASESTGSDGGAGAIAGSASAGAGIGCGTVSAISVPPSQFAAALQYKAELQHGIALFNLKPKKGLEYLRATSHIEWSHAGVAAFLKSAQGLDKREVGDYLGEHHEWNKGVLYAYVDGLDFTGMHFDDGIRHFLQGFRLPGEAQKIDRMMEKFAARFCECNPGVFQSADTAYVLAYSLIMLNTDAHSSQIKAKMTADEFVRNNRGINGADDLPAELLISLYNRIVSNEIKMKDVDESAALAAGGAGGRRRKEALYAVEVAKSVQRSQEAFKAKAGKRSTYLSSSHAETVVPMFQQLWGPLLAGLSVFVEEADRARSSHGAEADGGAQPLAPEAADEEVRVALDGFAHALHLACTFNLRTEQAAFLAALVKFTALGTGERLRPRHIDGMRVLVAVALRDGNSLGEGWAPVLKCVSEMHRLSMLAQGARTDAEALGEGLGKGGAAKGVAVSPIAMAQWGKLAAPHIVQQTRLSASAKAAAQGADGGSAAAAAAVHSEVERANAALVHAALSDASFLSSVDSFAALGLGPTPTTPAASSGSKGAQANGGGADAWQPEGSGGHLALDRLFSASTALDADAVVDFVVRLCAVSAEELLSPEQPRIFSLQKIVEVAYYNMSRIRLVWARIWTVLGGHFAAVGCHPHLGVGMYAVDALRQLANTFLERDEHALYAFQAAFLRPFETVMHAHPAPRMRELIVSCVRAVVQRKGESLRSGWQTLFAVLAAAAADADVTIVELGWAVCAEIISLPPTGQLASVCEGAAYLHAVACVRAFAAQQMSATVRAAAIGVLGGSLPEQVASGTLALSNGSGALAPEARPLATALQHLGASAVGGHDGGAESAAAKLLRRPTLALGQLDLDESDAAAAAATGATAGGKGSAPAGEAVLLPAHQRPLRLPPLAALLPPPSVLALSAGAGGEGGGAEGSEESAAALRDAMWWPLLAALAHCAADSGSGSGSGSAGGQPAQPDAAAAALARSEGAMEALFALLGQHAEELAPATWSALLDDLLLPLYSAPGPRAAHAPAAAAAAETHAETQAETQAEAEAEANGGGALAAGGEGEGEGEGTLASASSASAPADSAAHAAWVCGPGVSLVQRLGGLLVSSGKGLAFLTPAVTSFLLKCLASTHVPLVHASAECLAALLVACTPDLPASTWEAVVAALTAAVHRSRAVDGQGGSAAGGSAVAADTLPGGLRAFLLRCCTDVVQGLSASLSPATLISLLNLLGEESSRAQEARNASLMRCGAGGSRPTSVQLEAATRLCAAELAAVGSYWAAIIALYVPSEELPRLSAKERQRAEQQAALLNGACELDKRIRAVLDGSLSAFIAYAAAAAPRAPAAGSGAGAGLQPGASASAAAASSSAANATAAAACHPDGAKLALGLLSPLIGQLLRGILAMSHAQFVLHLPRLYAPLVALMGCDDRTVRGLVHDIFEQRATVFVGHAAQAGAH